MYICICMFTLVYMHMYVYIFAQSSTYVRSMYCTYIHNVYFILFICIVNMLQLKNATDAFIRHDITDHSIDQTTTWAEMCAVASSMFQSVEKQCSSEVVNVARSVDLLTSWAMDIFDVYVTCLMLLKFLINPAT